MYVLLGWVRLEIDLGREASSMRAYAKILGQCRRGADFVDPGSGIRFFGAMAMVPVQFIEVEQLKIYQNNFQAASRNHYFMGPSWNQKKLIKNMDVHSSASVVLCALLLGQGAATCRQFRAAQRKPIES